MIYVDSSVAVASLKLEERRPRDDFWKRPLVSSRLTEYEVRVRMNATPGASGLSTVDALLASISFSELTPAVLGRLYAPLPVPLRTLDAIHLATLSYLNSGLRRVPLATYDLRLAYAAHQMGFDLVNPS